MKNAVLAILAAGGFLAGCTHMRSVTSFENEGNAKARPTMELEPVLDTDWGIALGRTQEPSARVDPERTAPMNRRHDEGPTAKGEECRRGK